jgi:hypothetical protein
MRYEEIKGANLAVYSTILQTAGKDPCNPKIKKQCISCDNDILRQVRLGDDMKLVNTCIKCNEQWLD